MEAPQNDGRLARRPFKDSSREIQAHEILLSRISQLIEEYSVSMKVSMLIFPSWTLLLGLGISILANRILQNNL